MGVRLRNTFYSIDGVIWKIDIIDTSYSSTVLIFTTAPPGFDLKYNGDKERYDPIFASDCTVYALAEGSAIENLITDIAASTEGRFFVKIYKNTVLQWTGKLLQDKIRKEDVYYPYSFNMNFTDGIGALKDTNFDNAGALYTGRESFIGIICKILSKTGIDGQFAAGDTFLKTCVHWYDEHHNFYANWDPLKFSDVDHKAFYDYENEENAPKKCYDVLQEILYTFGCHIKQAAGVFQIIQPNEYVNNYLMTRTYNKAGTQLSYNYYENYRVAASAYSRLAGGIYSYYPPLYYVKRKYLYKQSPEGSNILPAQSSYDPVVDFLCDVSGGHDEYLKFKGTVNEIYTLTQYQAPFRVKYRMDIIITKSDGTKRYLYNGSNGTSGITWSSNSAHYMTFWSDCGLDPTLYYNDFFEIQFNTPVIPWDATGTFRFRKLGYFDHNGNVFTIIGGISFAFTCQGFFLEMIYQNQAVSEGEITFTAWNTNSGDKTKKIELPDSFIGDGPNLLSLGRIKTYDNFTWVNSTLWSIKSGSQHKKIHQLLVDEVLLGQQTPCDIFEGSINATTYSAEKCLVFADDSVYVPLSITLAAGNDVWKGQWWRIKFAAASPQDGLTLEPSVVDPDAEWYLQQWDSEPVLEQETDDSAESPTQSIIPFRSSTVNQQLAMVSEILRIATLNEFITEGDVKTTLTVDAIAHAIINSGDVLYIVRPNDFTMQVFQVNTNQVAGDTVLNINSITAGRDYPDGSFIVMKMYDLLKKLGPIWILATGTWNDAGIWIDTETWKDS